MKNKLILTLLFLALPAICFADFVAVRNDNDATLVAGNNGDAAMLSVDGYGRLFASAQITSVVPGVGATSLGKAEDAAAVSGDTIVPAGAVIQVTQAASAQDGDYGTLKTDLIGSLYITPGTSAATFSTATVAFGSLTGSFANALVNTNRLRTCVFGNTTDKAISWSDSTTALLSGQPSNTVAVLNFADTGRDVRTTIQVKYETAPGSGNAYINCWY